MLHPRKLSLMSIHLPALCLRQYPCDFWHLLRALFLPRLGETDQGIRPSLLWFTSEYGIVQGREEVFPEAPFLLSTRDHLFQNLQTSLCGQLNEGGTTLVLLE